MLIPEKIDVAIDYVTSITDNFGVGIKTTVNNNHNHIATNDVNANLAITGSLAW